MRSSLYTRFVALVVTYMVAFDPILAFALVVQESQPAAASTDAAAETDAAASEEPAEPEIEPALPDSWVEGLQWRNIGPANMGGRITSIATHPTDRSCYYVGTAAGGLLRTRNNGRDYDYLFSHEATCSVGDVQVSQSNPDIIWIGTGEANPRNSVSWGNGVYKSTDGGDTWEHKGLEGTFQTGRMAIHPDNPDVVYVGALGRLWGPNEERGLFKTTDGGETWEKVLYIDDKTGIIDVKMKPGEPDTMLVATYERQRDGFDTNDPMKKWGPGSGIHRTNDGGKTWTKVTEGLPTKMLGRIGLDWYATDTNIVYAVVESETITQIPENTAYLGVTSSNADIGARIGEVTEKSPAEEAGLEKDDIILRMEDTAILSSSALTAEIRKRLAGDTVQLEVVRDGKIEKIEVTFSKRPSEEEDQEEEEPAATESEKKETEKKEGEAEKADADAAKNEEEAKEPEKKDQREVEVGPFSSGLGGQRENIQEQQGPDGFEYGGIYRSDDAGVTWKRINSVNPRPMYYSQVRVDPSDNNHLYVLGTSLYRSKDGGETFTSDGGRGGVHVDHHALWIDPDDGRRMILGNDGGIYVTHDRMDNWDHHNHVAIGQFYRATVDSTRDYNVYGGLQDNGSWGGPSRVRHGRGPTNSDWMRVGGGDGFVCAVDRDDPNLIYTESQNGALGRMHLVTGERGFLRPRAPRGTRYRFNWNTPFMLSHHNTKIYYTAGNHVFRSLDRGTNIKPISPEITATDRGSATSLAESPRDPNILYVGTDDGALWMTKDGHNWIDLYNPPAEEKPAEEEAPSEETAAEIAAAGPDPLSGEWAGKVISEMIPEGQGDFTMTIKRTGADKWEGSLTSEMGENDLDNLKFNAKSGKLTFDSSNDSGMSLTWSGKLNDTKLKGTASMKEMGFEMGFEAELEKPAASSRARRAARAGRGGEGSGAGGGRVRAGGASQVREGGRPQSGAAGARQAGDDQGQRGGAAAAGGRGRVGRAGGGPGGGGPRGNARRGGRRGGNAGAEAAPESPFKPMAELVPDRRWVSSIEASRFEDGRVYVTFDGHRSDDDEPHVYMSEDFGRTWKSIRSNLPTSAGSTRDIEEDITNGDILYLGCEFSIWVSIDRGETWTKLNSNLPTVPVHEIEQHPTSGEILAATHGRSLWILDVSALRQVKVATVGEAATLFKPAPAIRWRSMPSRGSTLREFVGSNPPSGARISYALGSDARSVSIEIHSKSGELLNTLEGPKDAGMHTVTWNMARQPQQSDNTQRRFRRRGRPVEPGTYQVTLVVNGNKQETEVEITGDPDYPNNRWMEFEELESPYESEEEESVPSTESDSVDH